MTRFTVVSGRIFVVGDFVVVNCSLVVKGKVVSTFFVVAFIFVDGLVVTIFSVEAFVVVTLSVLEITVVGAFVAHGLCVGPEKHTE